jgi:hypothetical protein
MSDIRDALLSLDQRRRAAGGSSIADVTAALCEDGDSVSLILNCADGSVITAGFTVSSLMDSAEYLAAAEAAAMAELAKGREGP